MRYFVILIATLGFSLPSLAQTTQPAAAASTRPVGFDRWEKEIAAFEARDRENPPPKGALLFTGSSTIRMWTTLAQDYPSARVINRGFGGSEIADATHFADRIIFPYEPKMVLLRAGGKDGYPGKPVERVYADFVAFADKVHARLPDAQIVYISISPAPSRWDERDADRQVNERIKQYVDQHPKYLKYVETYDMTLTPDGKAREELF